MTISTDIGDRKHQHGTAMPRARGAAKGAPEHSESADGAHMCGCLLLLAGLAGLGSGRESAACVSPQHDFASGLVWMEATTRCKLCARSERCGPLSQ